MPEPRFLRVAHPLELWDGTKSASELAQDLADERSWSLFIRVEELEPLVVLGAFYGWRSGRGPMHDHGYITFTESELKLAEGDLIHSPSNFTYGWPTEVRDAHYDLEGHTKAGAQAFVAAVGSFSTRLQRVSRVSVLLAQCQLLQRKDAHPNFARVVAQRIAKLRMHEPAVLATLLVAAQTNGVLLPEGPG